MYPRESVVTIYNSATILCFTRKGVSFLLYFICLGLSFFFFFTSILYFCISMFGKYFLG